jgi:hypothetical protein
MDFLERSAVALRRPALLAVLALGGLAVLYAPGDVPRISRMAWLTHDETRYAGAALAAWAACALLGRWALGRRSASLPRWWRYAFGLVAAGVSSYAAYLAGRAVRDWGVRLDAPVVLYPARLFISGQRVPYRDIIDFNQPGSYLLYGFIDLIARSDRALRIVDAVAWMVAGVAARRAFALRGWWAAALAAGIYMFTHLEDTGVDCMQREVFVLALVLVTGALLRSRRYVAAGAVFSLCFWMKFHSTLLVLPFVWDVIRREDASRDAWRALGKTAGVVVAASVLVLAGLWGLGALPRWWELVTQYLPLYGRMAGTLGFSGPELLRYRRLLLFLDPTAHPAILGVALLPPLLTTSRARLGVSVDAVRLVVGFYLCTLAYVLVQGTFWHYHSIPSCFAIGAMVPVLLRNPANVLEGLGRLTVAAAVCFHVVGPRAFATMDWASSGRNEDGLTIARWLEFELPPGEAVQPLDIVQGVVDGMWRADVPLATPYLYDLYLYHDVDTPIIRRWRRQLLEDLQRERPYFIIEATRARFVRPYGEGTDEHFPELEAFIAANYDVYRDASGFRWWRRRDP